MRPDEGGGMIGHNNPPAVEAMALHVEDLFKLVSDTTDGSEVTSDEQEAALDGLLDDVRTAKRDSEETRKAEKEPHLRAGQAVDAAWKPVLARLDAAADEIKKLLTPYRVAKQKAKDEAARKAREEAEAKEAAARAAMEEGSLEQRFEAEQQFEAAKKLTAVANKIDRSATGLRAYDVVTVTDRRAALNWIAKNDADALTAFVKDYARRNAPRRSMDGVTVEQERRVA